MKIALSCNTIWGKGGQGQFLNHAALGLSELGNLTVFCRGKLAEDKLLPPNTDIITLGEDYRAQGMLRMPYLRRRQDWSVLLSDLDFDRKVQKKLQLMTPDLVIGVAGQCYQSLNQAKRRGSQIWLYCLNCYLPFMKEQTDNEIVSLKEGGREIHSLMIKRFHQECRLADKILLNSEVAKTTFVEAGFPSSQLAVLTPPVDSCRFTPCPALHDTFRVLYVGTVAPRKGVHYLIKAFLDADIANSELLIVGGAANRTLRTMLDSIKREYSNIKQEFWDFSKDDPSQVFGRCSILVLPSVEDGFGLVALEAMACGLPVIVTNHCGAADIVTNGVNGFTVAARCTESLAEKLKFFARSPDRRLQMGETARCTAQRYTQSNYNQELSKIVLTAT